MEKKENGGGDRKGWKIRKEKVKLIKFNERRGERRVLISECNEERVDKGRG